MSLPKKFNLTVQRSFKELQSKSLTKNSGSSLTKNAEKLLKFYKSLLTPKGEISKKKLSKAIHEYRDYLYEKKYTQYKICFVFEKSNNLESVIEGWENVKNDSDLLKFQVSPYATFFFPMEGIGGPSIPPNTILSILAIPSTHFDAVNNYTNKSDYHREYRGSKQTYIGDCTYYVDPCQRIVTWQVGGCDQLGIFVINENRHLGLDIAITKDPHKNAYGFMSQYLQGLKDIIGTQNPKFYEPPKPKIPMPK